MKRLGLLLIVIALLITSGCTEREVTDYTEFGLYTYNISAEDRLYYSIGSDEVNYEALKEAVEEGADVNRLCRSLLGSDVPLVVAAKLGNKRVIKYLIANGADVNVSDEEGKPVVIYVAEDKELLKLFADSGYSFGNRDKDERYPLDYAIDTHNMLIIGNMLSYCNKISDKGLKELLKSTADDFYTGGTLILSELAVKDSTTSPSAIEVGLSRALRGDSVKPTEVAPQYKSLTLYATAAKGSGDNLSLLFNGLGLSVDVNNLLSCAVAAGNLSTTKYLLSIGADIDIINTYTDGSVEQSFSLIDTAAYYNQTNMVKYLLQRGLEYQEVESNTYTPLDYAVLNNNYKLAQVLLSEYPNMKCKVSACCDSDMMFKLLLKYNKLDGWSSVAKQSDVDRLKAYYGTVGAPNFGELEECIEIFAREDATELTDCMLELYDGSDTEDICRDALITAVRCGSCESVERLIEYIRELDDCESYSLKLLWRECGKSKRIYELMKDKYKMGR